MSFNLQAKAFILDTPAFLSGLISPLAPNFTVYQVIKELKKFSFDFYSSYFSAVVKVRQPTQESLRSVEKIALASGDLQVLSATDLSLLALAHQIHFETELELTLVTDDYAIINVGKAMNLEHILIGIKKERFRQLIWKWYCPVCHRLYKGGQTKCAECGVSLRRSTR
jgi:rRNA maturation endonuclease Nob1